MRPFTFVNDTQCVLHRVKGQRGFKIKFTRVEDVRSAESNRSEDDVAAEEEEVGDAEGSQQVVEHIVHLPGFQILDVYHRVVRIVLHHIYLISDI